MSDFLDRLERELHTAARREEAARRPLRLPSLRVPAVAAGLAAAAVAVVLAVGGGGPGTEREAAEPGRPVPPQLIGTYRRSGSGSRGERLWVRGGSLRLLDPDDPVPSAFVGFVTTRGDVMTVRVDPARTAQSDWPDHGCHGARRTAAGRYRFTLREGVLRFVALADPCRGRVRLLTARPWHRAP